MIRDWRRNVVLRKLRRYGAVPPRLFANMIEARDDSRPPLIADSVPKSGTHLLIQVLAALPGVRDWGLFLASQPSFRFRELSAKRLGSMIGRMANDELAGAHLHFDPLMTRAMQERGVCHCFVFRDPRDVVVSEAHYLTHMNRWHRLHRFFARLPDEQARIRLAIEGLPESAPVSYPPIGERYRRYLGWLEDPGTLAIRYESLAGPGMRETVRGIVEHWVAAGGESGDIEKLSERALAAVDPSSSHTFHRGTVGGWRRVFNPELLELFQRHTDELTGQLGYEDF